MNERTLTTMLVDTLTVMLPRTAVIVKHSDRFTSGVPDLSVSVGGKTVWLEVKYIRTTSSLNAEVKPIQKLMCRLLERATKGKCFYVVYYEHPRAVQLIRPSLYPTPDLRRDGFDHSIVKDCLS